MGGREGDTVLRSRGLERSTVAGVLAGESYAAAGGIREVLSRKRKN